jgi:Ion channel
MTTSRSPRKLNDRFSLVFALLVVSYLLSALLSSPRSRALDLVLYAVVLLIALRSAGLPPRTARRLRWAMLTGSLVAAALVLVGTGRVVVGSAALWLAAVTATTVCVVVWRVLHHERITLQTVFGALSAYLLIGFTFAALFAATAQFDTRTFFVGGQPAENDNLQYFTFVTLTTTGYGDLVAAHNPGRALATMEALIGQIFLVTLVARLVSQFGTARRRPDQPQPTEPDRAGGPDPGRP